MCLITIILVVHWEMTPIEFVCVFHMDCHNYTARCSLEVQIHNHINYRRTEGNCIIFESCLILQILYYQELLIWLFLRVVGAQRFVHRNCFMLCVYWWWVIVQKGLEHVLEKVYVLSFECFVHFILSRLSCIYPMLNEAGALWQDLQKSVSCSNSLSSRCRAGLLQLSKKPCITYTHTAWTSM